MKLVKCSNKAATKETSQGNEELLSFLLLWKVLEHWKTWKSILFIGCQLSTYKCVLFLF